MKSYFAFSFDILNEFNIEYIIVALENCYSYLYNINKEGKWRIDKCKKNNTKKTFCKQHTL